MSRRYGHDQSHLGAKLGPKLALLVSQAMTDNLRRSGGYRAEIGTQAALKFFQTLERERNTHLSDLLGMFTGHEQTPQELEKALRFMEGGSGELSQLLVHSALSGAVATSIGSGIADLLAPVNQEILHQSPFQIPEAGTAAQLTAARLIEESTALDTIRRSGIDEGWGKRLIEAAYSWPALGELLELVRRKVIDGSQLVLALRRQGVPEQYLGPILNLQHEHLAPADAALATLRGVITEADGETIAALSGVGANDFKILVENTGEPPGLEQLLEAYRRDIIPQARLQRGIRQSRVRDEWIDVVERLRFTRASPSDALRGVVQAHITSEQGKAIALEGGLDPRDWQWLLETEGNPVAPIEAISLWRRGKMSQAQVEQAIREGRTKNKYIPALLNLKRALPSLYQIKQLLASGSISEAEGSRILHELGYETDLVSGLVHSATHGQVVKEKQLAKSEILSLYFDHAIDDHRATQLLKALGYSAANVSLLLRLTELQREKTIRQASMSPIRSAYLHRHITEREASAKLDQLGIPHAERDFALAQWAVDREATKKSLTEAQIVKANERKLLTDSEAESRLLDLGYTLGDARILLDLEKTRSHPAP